MVNSKYIKNKTEKNDNEAISITIKIKELEQKIIPNFETFTLTKIVIRRPIQKYIINKVTKNIAVLGWLTPTFPWLLLKKCMQLWYCLLWIIVRWHGKLQTKFVFNMQQLYKKTIIVINTVKFLNHTDPQFKTNEYPNSELFTNWILYWSDINTVNWMYTLKWIKKSNKKYLDYHYELNRCRSQKRLSI